MIRRITVELNQFHGPEYPCWAMLAILDKYIEAVHGEVEGVTNNFNVVWLSVVEAVEAKEVKLDYVWLK